jgi:hypothetical protein
MGWYCLAGLLLGTAPILKQPGIVFPAFAVTWTALVWVRERRAGGTVSGKGMLVLAAAAVAPGAVTLALLAWAGVLGQAWRWMFSYAAAYSGMQSFGTGLATLGARVGAMALPAAGFAVLAVAGLVMETGNPQPRWKAGGRGFAALLLAFSFAGVCPGLYFRHHYFIMLLPAIAMLVGRGVWQLSRRGLAGAALAIALTLAAAAQGLLADRDLLFSMTPGAISRHVYGANPFPESQEVARYIAERSAPADRIAVLGSEPQIFFYARRASATRYLYLYPLLEPNPFGPEMKEELIREVEAADPAFVVWVNVPTSWDTRVGAARRVMEWAAGFLARYDLVGRVAIRGPDRTDYAWDEEAARLGPQGANVLVFRRRER